MPHFLPLNEDSLRRISQCSIISTFHPYSVFYSSSQPVTRSHSLLKNAQTEWSKINIQYTLHKHTFSFSLHNFSVARDILLEIHAIAKRKWLLAFLSRIFPDILLGRKPTHTHTHHGLHVLLRDLCSSTQSTHSGLSGRSYLPSRLVDFSRCSRSVTRQ